ncbi:signal peptidase II [Clostridium sp. JNZ J1-5]
MEILLVFLGISLDRISKIWALKSLKTGNDIVVIDNFFSFQYLENRGAAFGIFQGKVFLLTAVTLLVVIGMIYYLIKYKPDSKVLRLSFALIISGAIGNLYDRVFYKYVVDFILLHYRDIYYFPTFNVADMLVVVGTFLLAICVLREGK